MPRYVGNYMLDVRPDRIDLRDRVYAPPVKSLKGEFPSSEHVAKYMPLYLKHDMVLDQGSEGACTGFGLACTINFLLWRTEVIERGGKPTDKVSPRMLYHLARFYDEWPGEDYEGSSCRGAVKAWHKHGVCLERLWQYGKRFTKPKDGWEEDAAGRPLGVYYRIDKNSVVDMQAAIQEVGAIYVSAEVHAGWNVRSSKRKTVSHQGLPEIAWNESDKIEGGHAFALVGYNQRGFIVQNSWGPAWGQGGFAVLSYRDWVQNGSDAWVCVMGAPTRKRMPSHYSARYTDRDRELAETGRVTFFSAARAPATHRYRDPAVVPWDESTAYRHSVVMGNEGRVINRLVTAGGAKDAVEEVVLAGVSNHFKALSSSEKPRLVLFAHGGLNAEGDSIKRIRTLAPYFQANGVYPVFFSWKTGLQESILSIMEDAVGRLFPRSEGLTDVLRDAKERASDVLDRTLEVACENLGVKAIWSQMKQNAGAASRRADGDRGGFLAAQALAALRRMFPALELHLVGHSAGSILLGHMLDDLNRQGIKVSSCTLYAAACTVEFAQRTYARAIEQGLLRKQSLYMHVLTDDRERGDTVGPYRKSLLYLVSRALEDWHKTPLLGMANSFDPAKNEQWSAATKTHLKNWQRFWGGSPIATLGDEQVVTAAVWKRGRIDEVMAKIASAHGSFDNDVVMIDQTIRRIVGRDRLEHPVENLRY